jgi:hypothetical protein
MGDWKAKIEALLRERYSIYYSDLVHPRPLSIDDEDSVQVGYIDFFEWLGGIPSLDWWGHDPTLSNGLAVDIVRYSRDKSEHYKDVKDQLQIIKAFDTGKALLKEIQFTGFTITIRPYLDFGNLGFNATAEPNHSRHAHAPGCSKGDGQGSDSHLSYTAQMWPPYSSKRYLPSKLAETAKAPGNMADEILFHELVHATRQMRGVMCNLHVNHDYDNEEEYIATIITNIYLSEKTGRDLVADHRDHILSKADADAFLENPQGVDETPRALIDLFRSQQREFFDALGDIRYNTRTGTGPKFNPIRIYKDEDKAIREHFSKIHYSPTPK